MDLENFTQCLPSDVEIIDLSHNRIRKLTETDLEKYSKLKMLYLHDNFLGVIDDESFKGKDYLQTIDLSKNGLTKLPLDSHASNVVFPNLNVRTKYPWMIYRRIQSAKRMYRKIFRKPKQRLYC
ncbi:hypothetical protein MTP99_019316 [Tenebrio molitor]|nr:hypothetical protein MTP99_019316 [Tenebrio molitor]